MILTEEIYSRLLMMVGDADSRQQELLRALSAGADAALAVGVPEKPDSPEWRQALITAGSLYAMASWLELDPGRNVGQFTAGDVTIRNGDPTAAAKDLRARADRMLQMLRTDAFSFRGV